MLTSHSVIFQALLRLSSSLRAAGQPREAMVLLEGKLEGMESGCLAMAYKELIYAALESGDRSKATALARKLNDIDPANPLVASFLGEPRRA